MCSLWHLWKWQCRKVHKDPVRSRRVSITEDCEVQYSDSHQYKLRLGQDVTVSGGHEEVHFQNAPGEIAYVTFDLIWFLYINLDALNFMSDVKNFGINHLQKEFVQASSNCWELEEWWHWEQNYPLEKCHVWVHSQRLDPPRDL